MNVEKRWRKLKDKNKDSIILILMGDSYVTYAEDAKVLSDLLGIPLMQKDGIDTSSFHRSEIDKNIIILVKRGKRVGIADFVGYKK